MGRIGVSEYQVFKAADQLATEGVNPSVDTVRLELGNTGSRTTINKYLKAWRERRAHRETAGANLSGHLRQVITEQAELLLTALEAESGAKLQAKSQEFEAALHVQNEKNQQLDFALSQSQSELATLREAHESQKLQLLQQQSDLTDLRDQNQSYREALAKEIGRHETLDRAIVERDRQLAAVQKELKASQARNEIMTESYAVKSTELQLLQQQERDQRALIKEKTSDIKNLNQQLRGIRAQHDKDIGRLSRSLTALTQSRSTKKNCAKPRT